MEIGAVQPSNGISGNNPVASGEMTKEVFLQLLSTQLQHQDPLEPASDVEFIQQMATFAQLEQQQLTNSNLQVMGLYESSINNSNALNLVGKEVKIQDNTVDHVEGQSHTFFYEGSGEAARVFIRVTDADGNEVYSQTQVGSQDGEQEFTWHGVNTAGDPVEDGDYTIHVDLEDAEGNTYASPITQHQQVNGISYENGSIMVLVGDKRIPIENVVEVYGAGQAGSGSAAGAAGGQFKSAPLASGFQTSRYTPGQIIPFPGRDTFNAIYPTGVNAGGR